MSISDIESQAAATYGVPQSLAADLFGAEDASQNQFAVNPTSGALGLGQILPSTAAAPGYGVSPLTNPFDPTANANFAMQYLAALFKNLGSWVAAVVAYYPNAATDPNYASTYAAAQQADTGTTGVMTPEEYVMTPSATATVGEQATGQTASQMATSAIKISSLSGIWNLMSRGGLVVLGIGLVLVAVMALTRRSDVATETQRLAMGVRSVAK